MKGSETKLKFYVYISGSKVEMLYQQIPQSARSTLAAELKLNLTVIEAMLKKEVPIETRISKLRVVSEYIEKNLDVGSIDKPGAYFKGTLNMRWGPWLEWAIMENRRADEKGQMVWFSGETPHTIVGLGGSSKHIIGREEKRDLPDSMSNLACILGLLADELQLPFPSLCRSMSESEIRRRALQAVEDAVHMISRVPSQRLEFLSKAFLVGPSVHRDKHVLIGSPIYVAMAE